MPPRLAVLPQYLLPKKTLTALAGLFARAQAGSLTTQAIRWFVRRYGVDMSEAALGDVRDYRTFNEFFTRELKAGSRSMANSDFICPVDGAISQFGAIKNDVIIQAKGHSYTTEALLGGNRPAAMQYENGWFATIYLSPRDYHRIHMPCDGKLEAMTYVPGSLFSVNPTTARGVPGLFARNERLICEFSTAFGPMALVLVGATIVGSMATVWHGTVNPPRGRKVRRWTYEAHGAPIALRKGEEMGRFMLGSTVVLLMPRPDGFGMAFNPGWQPDGPVQLGHAMASYQPLEQAVDKSIVEPAAPVPTSISAPGAEEQHADSAAIDAEPTSAAAAGPSEPPAAQA